MKPAPWLLRVETIRTPGQPEEVSVYQAAAGVPGKLLSQWHQSGLMPADHLGQGIYHQQGSDAGLFERGGRGVAQPQPPHHHVQFRGGHAGQADLGQGILTGMKQAGHEKFVV